GAPQLGRNARAARARAVLGEREPREGPPDEARPEEVLRDQGSGAGAETRAGMRARPDVIEPVDRCAMAGERRAGTPDEVLVERARAAVDVPAGHVHVRGLDVGRREDDALEERRVEVRELAAEP